MIIHATHAASACYDTGSMFAEIADGAALRTLS